MRFVADGMLGKLVHWLRILGYDVKYSVDFDDDQLISISRNEKRVLLTRDLELYKRATAREIEAFYVSGLTREEKLAELAERFNIRLYVDMAKSRCPICNAKVKTVRKEEIVGKVKEKTFSHYSEFWKCEKCGQVYWQGAHWAKIGKMLETAKAIQKLDEPSRV